MIARRARALRKRVIATAREMHRRGLVTGTVGNVSARSGGGMLITPTRQAFVEMRPADVVAIGLNGKRIVAGRGEPSIEWPLHAAIYRARPDVSAIVHTHSPYATARSFDPAPIIVRTEERVYLDLTEVAVARMLAAGSEALAAETVAALGSRFAVLLARHGVVAVGRTLDGALEMCSTVEHQAQIDWLLT